MLNVSFVWLIYRSIDEGIISIIMGKGIQIRIKSLKEVVDSQKSIIKFTTDLNIARSSSLQPKISFQTRWKGQISIWNYVALSAVNL